MSEMNKQQVPKIRFTGFSEDLVSMEFREFTKLSQGLQISIDKRFLEPGDSRVFYITNEFLNPNSKKRFYIENPPQSVIANEEDILMTRTGNTGKVVTNVSGAYHNNFFKITYDKTVDKDYLYYLLNEPRIQSEILARAGSSTIPDLNHSDFYSLKGMYPSKKEQTQIGNFFQQLDKLIELQTRTVESAETYKKAMLQKMFPQKGEKVPRVRFEGVSGDWDKMALGRTIKSEFKGRAQESLLFEGNTEYLDANRLNGGMPRLVSLEKNVEYEDILILWDGSKAGTVYKGFSGVLGSTLKCYKIAKNYNQEFIYQYVKSHEERIFQQYRTPNIPHVIRDFTDMFMVVVPCVEEQTKIGNFFQKLDQNIESEKKKLEQYQTMKRALLQRMFV